MSVSSYLVSRPVLMQSFFSGSLGSVGTSLFVSSSSCRPRTNRREADLTPMQHLCLS
jgi:hypothetical protein